MFMKKDDFERRALMFFDGDPPAELMREAEGADGEYIGALYSKYIQSEAAGLYVDIFDDFARAAAEVLRAGFLAAPDPHGEIDDTVLIEIQAQKLVSYIDKLTHDIIDEDLQR